MRIEVLGPLRVVDGGGVDRTPRSAQQRQVLVALAAAGERGRSADLLEMLLWPGGAPSSNALQAVISKLRKTVAPAAIESDAGRYRLVGHRCDLDDLEELLAAGRGDAALALVRGEPLVDLDGAGDDGPWWAERTRLAGLARRARVLRWRDAVDGDDPASVVAELEAATTADPVDEELWALLVTAHSRAGRDGAALRALSSARTALADQLGIEPGPELRELERRVLADDEPTLEGPPAGRWRGVPAALSSFIGREDVLAGLANELQERRLVTLVGPGGAGKTTTSQELARRGGFRAAVAELAPIGDRDGVVRRTARALGLRSNDQVALGAVSPYADPLERVIEAIAESGELLLVVDNCEHVVDEVAEVVHRLLAECPALQVLATSREALGVPGERVVPLPPLPEDDAAALFRERAAEHGIAIDEVGREPALVRDICGRLDGLPLAIELAAARLRSMTVDELADRLDDRFEVLAGGPRTVDARQQTLRAVVDWSHELLDPAERVVFRRLAPFVGGASARAAEAVCSGTAPDGVELAVGEVVPIVERLVDKSLVVVERTRHGIRFSMLQTLHEYAVEQLAAAGERDAVLVRHARQLADALRPARWELVGSEQPRWYDLVRRELPNVDAALDVALARGDAQLALELVTPIGWFYFMSGELERGAVTLARALACEGESDPTLRGLALGYHGWLLANGPDVEPAVAATTEGMSLLEHSSDAAARGLVANTHAMALFFSGRLEPADDVMATVVERSVASGDPWIVAINDIVRAEVAQFLGRMAEAEEMFARAASELERLGDRFAYALAITEAAELAEMTGDYDRAVALLRRGLELVEEVGFSGHPLAMRARLGNVEVLRGNLDAGRREHELLIADASARGVPWLLSMAHMGLATIARREGDLDRAAAELDAAWAVPRSRSVPYIRILVLGGMGFLADQRGDAASAVRHQADAVAVARDLLSPRGSAYSLEAAAGALAVVAGDRSAHELGARLLGGADALRRRHGGPMPAAERYDVDRAEQRLRASLGDAFEVCLGSGAERSARELFDAFSAYADGYLARR